MTFEGLVQGRNEWEYKIMFLSQKRKGRVQFMEYPLKKGWYIDEDGDVLYVIAEEEGLVHCKREENRFAILADNFVRNYKKLIKQ